MYALRWALTWNDGNLYGANYEGGQYGYGNIFKTTPSGTLTILHQFDGMAPDYSAPWAPPVQGKDGNYYGAAAAYVAYKITAAGKFSVISKSCSGGGFGSADSSHRWLLLRNL